MSFEQVTRAVWRKSVIIRYMVLSTSDPGTFFLLMLMVGIVLIGFYYFLREIIADAIALANKRAEQRREDERREGKIR